MKSRAGTDADKQSLFLSGTSCAGKSIFGGNFDNAVDQFSVKRFGNEIGTDSLKLMRSCRFAGKQGTFIRLYGTDHDTGITLFQIASDAGKSAAGTDSGNENIDFSVGIAPDFRSC